MKRMISACAIVLLAMTSAWAADVAGKWTAHVPGAQGQGDSDITLVFMVDGEELTGTIDNSLMPGEVEIEEGEISGDDVSFSLMRRIGEVDMKVVWTGTVSEDEIKFTREAQGGGPGIPPTEIVAKRPE